MNDKIATSIEGAVTPFSLKDAPALIETLLPVHKLSIESYKEQMAVHGKTLTALGSYWKGRKPLILNKAAVLGCLLPATADSQRDLEVFEMLMGMDDESMLKRLGTPGGSLPKAPYKALVDKAKRPEEIMGTVHSHVWTAVNEHLGTNATSFPDLVEQLGVMRFGHRPRVADTFCGSGQIPFEAARLGCDVFASDLSPVACMLTWGAFNIVGGSEDAAEALAKKQAALVTRVQAALDKLGVETDGRGWRAKVFLYCVEARCPQTGWMVPLLPSLIISKGYKVVAELVPDRKNKRYDIKIHSDVSDDDLEAASFGTVRSDGKGKDPYLTHEVGGKEYRTKISTLRGDYKAKDGSNANRLRPWTKSDFKPRPEDIYQERLYCIEWQRAAASGRSDEYQFRAVTTADLARESAVAEYVEKHLAKWQSDGVVPDMRIEAGDKTDEPIRTRGWTYWHHLFNPRQLLLAALVNQYSDTKLKFGFTQVLNNSSRCSRWESGGGGGGITKGVFDNQALNTLFNYGCRGSAYAGSFLQQRYKTFPIESAACEVVALPASQVDERSDIYITDPPYGDAVKYEEILEFFIAWLRKNPPPEFAGWTWDSRRSLAIKGEDDDFRRNMVAAYKNMADHMPDNGIQIIMFTHTSGSIWSDMANIVWAASLRVTAAWYVATETESALRGTSNVKGTVLLVVRKRMDGLAATRDDLAWEIQEEVESQVRTLTGLNQQARGLYRDENLFRDADLRLAGYAAAMRALTRYSEIDGRDMAHEASRPRVKGETTFVDDLIKFAADLAIKALAPEGLAAEFWKKLGAEEQFYLKLLEMEAKGQNQLDDYQNFAKAYKVPDLQVFMAKVKANDARLKSAVEFGRAEMGEGKGFPSSPTRAVLYAIMELCKEKDADEVLAHLSLNIPTFYDTNQRKLLVEISEYIGTKCAGMRPDEASAARVLADAIRNQQM